MYKGTNFARKLHHRCLQGPKYTLDKSNFNNI